MDLLQPLRQRRPYWGCLALIVLVVPCLSCGAGWFVSTIPTEDAISRDAVMTSFGLEEQGVLERGYSAAETQDFRHEAGTEPDELEVAIAPQECIAVIAATWGHQYIRQLTITEREGGRVLSGHEGVSAFVTHAQWCSHDQPQLLAVQVQRGGADMWGREGQSEANTHIAVYRAPSAAVGGLRGITRGLIPDEVLAERTEQIWLEADRDRPSGTPIGEPLSIASYSSRLIPEDLTTYAELYRGAQGNSVREVNPRVRALPETAPAAWRPGDAHSQAALRSAHRPDAQPAPTHPPVREMDDTFARVLAVVNSDGLGARCAEIQFVRMAFGFRAPVRRAPAGETEGRALTGRDNVARDRLCAGQGVFVYAVPAEDHAAYTLRMFEG